MPARSSSTARCASCSTPRNIPTPRLCSARCQSSAARRSCSPSRVSRPILPPCPRSEEHTSELQSRPHLVCRLLPEKKHRRVAGGENDAIDLVQAASGVPDAGDVLALRHDRPYRASLTFFFNDTATTEIYTLSLHDALPI